MTVKGPSRLEPVGNLSRLLSWYFTAFSTSSMFRGGLGLSVCWATGMAGTTGMVGTATTLSSSMTCLSS